MQVFPAAVSLAQAARAVAGAELVADPAPAAVCAVNDPMAVGVIGAARAAGIDVPGDLSVVGYDDSPLAAYELVSLTTIGGNPRALGEQAGHMLVALIEQRDAPVQAPLMPRVVERSSTAPRSH